MSSNRLVHSFELVRRNPVFVGHVPSPVIFPRESLASFEVSAAWIGAVIRLRLQMFVVDMAVEMRLGAESLVAPVVRAVVLAVMITFMMVEFMRLVELPLTFIADVFAGRR